MAGNPYLTIGEIARKLDVPAWLVRRAVDSVCPDMPRAGLYRLVPEAQLAAVSAEIRKRSRRRAEAAEK